MKNKPIKSIITSTISTSLLATSCTQKDSTINVNGTIHAHEQTKEQQAIPFTQEDRDLIALVEQASIDILNEPKMAKLLLEDKTEFINKYNYPNSIELDPGLCRLLFALSDESIIATINNNDIIGFYELCKQKQLIPQIDTDSIKSVAHLTKGNDNFTSPQRPAVVLAALLVGVVVGVTAVAAIAAVVYVATHTDVLVTENVSVDTGTSTSGTKTKSTISTPIMDVMKEKCSVCDIWQLKGKYAQTKIVVDLYVEEQIQQIIQIAEEINPSLFESYSEEEIKNFIKLCYLNSL